jgi:hypothetical protein
MTVPVINQIRSFATNRYAAATGALLGGIVPLLTYTMAHSLRAEWTVDTAILGTLVAGGLAFSFPKVSQWASIAFQSQLAGCAFTLLMEGTMTYQSGWPAYTALAVVVAINAVSSAYNLVSNVKAHKPMKAQRKRAK